MANKITYICYNKYSANGAFVGKREYIATTQKDYDRVMDIIERNPEEYELVNEKVLEGEEECI